VPIDAADRVTPSVLRMRCSVEGTSGAPHRRASPADRIGAAAAEAEAVADDGDGADAGTDGGGADGGSLVQADTASSTSSTGAVHGERMGVLCMDRHSEASARPTVAYAVLGLLARRSRSGYELAAALREPVSFFWSAPHSQLYPTLSALETDGLVTHEQSPGPGPRARKTYRITGAGRRALADWAVSTPPPRAGRDEFVLRAYSAWVAEPHAVAALFRTEAERHRARLVEYERFRRELVDASGGAPPGRQQPEFGNWLALHNGLGYERAYLEWCEWALDLLLAADRRS